jgi:hypothetical protein
MSLPIIGAPSLKKMFFREGTGFFANWYSRLREKPIGARTSLKD